MTPEQFWANLVGRHEAYLSKLGSPDLGEPDPRAGCTCHVFAEAGFNMVHSYFTHNPGLLFTTKPATGPAVTYPGANLDYRMNFAPRVTLGVLRDDGWGVRGSWWQLEAGTTTPLLISKDATLRTLGSSVPVFGVPGFTSPGPVAQQLKIFGDLIAANNDLHVAVFDLELFRNFRTDCWSFLVGGGARYGYLGQGYHAYRTNSGTAKSGTTTVNLLTDSDVVNSGRNFGGVGPTGVFEVRRRLGGTGFSLYGLARGSVLFGPDRLQSYQRTVLNQQTTVGSAAPKTVASSIGFQGGQRGENTIPMADFEAGVDWTRQFGHVLMFVQAGLVNQTWFDSGSATSTSGDTGFFGLRFTAGLNY
jgi:hypothetical protein